MRRDGETRVLRRYGVVKPRRAAPPRRDLPVLAHVRCASSVDLHQTFPDLGEFPHVFGMITELTVIT